MANMTPEAAARLLHNTYERLAPEFGYQTRADTRVFDPESPNGRLMVAVCGVLLQALDTQPTIDRAEDVRATLGDLAAGAPVWAVPDGGPCVSVTLGAATWSWDWGRRQWVDLSARCPMCCAAPCRCATVFSAPGAQPPS